jgi:hypothetical protein
MATTLAAHSALTAAARAAPAARRAPGAAVGNSLQRPQGHCQPQQQRRHQHIQRWTPPAPSRHTSIVARAEFAEIDADAETAPGGVAEGRFGPDAILLVGFTPEETTRWRKELDDVQAEFVRLVTCTKAMVWMRTPAAAGQYAPCIQAHTPGWRHLSPRYYCGQHSS